jgi:hypothetical protein
MTHSGGGLLADKIPASLRAIQFYVFEIDPSPTNLVNESASGFYISLYDLFVTHSARYDTP